MPCRRSPQYGGDRAIAPTDRVEGAATWVVMSRADLDGVGCREFGRGRRPCPRSSRRVTELDAYGFGAGVSEVDEDRQCPPPRCPGLVRIARPGVRVSDVDQRHGLVI